MATTGGTLFFDGDCGMCTRCRDVLLRLDRTGAVRTQPLQAPGTAARVGASDTELMASIWWLGDDGTVCRAAEAANVAAGAALGTGLPLRVYRFPLVGRLQELAYRWIAEHRYLVPGVTPHCATTPHTCGR